MGRGVKKTPKEYAYVIYEWSPRFVGQSKQWSFVRLGSAYYVHLCNDFRSLPIRCTNLPFSSKSYTINYTHSQNFCLLKIHLNLISIWKSIILHCFKYGTYSVVPCVCIQVYLLKVEYTHIVPHLKQIFNRIFFFRLKSIFFMFQTLFWDFK